jgi:hypothetical protein
MKFTVAAVQTIATSNPMRASSTFIMWRQP